VCVCVCVCAVIETQPPCSHWEQRRDESHFSSKKQREASVSGTHTWTLGRSRQVAGSVNNRCVCCCVHRVCVCVSRDFVAPVTFRIVYRIFQVVMCV